MMDASQHISTLRRLRDRLSDLSMRNRSVRLTRLYKKRAFDLAWLDQVYPGDSIRVLARLLGGRRQGVALLQPGADEESQALHRGLTYLDREARLVEGERGVYDLAIGLFFLCGTVAEGKYIQAPLFLLPRRLELARRSRAGSRWLLSPLGEAREINVNRTLLLALQKYADITLDIEALEEAAGEILFGRSREPGWIDEMGERLAERLRSWGLRVAPWRPAETAARDDASTPEPERLPPLPEYRADELPSPPLLHFEMRPHAVLSRFPLADTALLNDYDELVRILEIYPQQPLGYAGALLGDREAFREASQPEREAVHPRWHIEPVDESQEAALAQVLAGRSLALYGPPGTGKSQFIVNLVANALAAGKRVLVVSQKRPALDVIAQRLGSDLGRFVALVHDPVRDRQALMERIIAGLSPELSAEGVADESRRRRLLDTISEQERWFDEVHTALCAGGGGEGLSPFAAYAIRLQYPGSPQVLSVRRLPEMAPDLLAEAVPALEEYIEDRLRYRPPGSWKAERPGYGDRSRDDLERLMEDELPAVIGSVQDGLAWNDGRPPEMDDLERTAARHAEWEALAGWCGQVRAAPRGIWSWLPVLAGVDRPADVVLEDNAVLIDLLTRRDRAGGLEIEPQAAEGAETLFSEWESLSGRWYRFALPAWHRCDRAVRERLAASGLDSDEVRVGIETWRARAAYGAARATLLDKLRVWQHVGLDLETLSSTDLQRCREEGLAAAAVLESWRTLPTAARDLWGGMPETEEDFSKLAAAVAHASKAPAVLRRLAAAEQILQAWVGSHAGQWMDEALRQRRPESLVERCRSEIAAEFERMSAADRRMAEAEERYPELADLVWMATRGGVEDVARELWTAYAERWVRDAETGGCLVLRDLTQAEAERRRQRLAAAWDALPGENRRVLAARLHDAAAAIPAADRAELRKRAEQRRRRWPIRKMVERLWERGLSDLFPVWLCSPETVAAVFPLRQAMFDLVVFDEASQCTLAQGLTVVYRGRTVVIAGDEQQLPPSNLFSTTLEEDDEDEIIDEESLLSRAKAAGSDMALAWHYRSRYPELIQFSNQTFYNGGLRVSPLPAAMVSPPPLEWVPVAGRWEKRANEAEARLAVEILERYLREHPDVSLGIITLNRQQADRIQDILDERLQASPTLRERYEEAMSRDQDARPFIRNLENVQGDERDVIVLSIAYAPDASGRVPLRFGALSRSGGERRLNVAVSRARQKMIVLCSFDPETQLEVPDQASLGARTLQEYLCYAKKVSSGGLDNRSADGVPATTPLHHVHARVVDHLADRLEAAGWQVERAVGASAARIDLAVRSRREPDRYVLGVLLDGPGAAWAESAIGREVGRIAYLSRYLWTVFPLTIRELVCAGDDLCASLVQRLEVADAGCAEVPSPPSVAVKPAAHTDLDLPPAEDIDEARLSEKSVPEPSEALLVVGPGCTVRYRVLDTGREKTIVLVGPTVPRGIETVALDAPVAEALLDATVGDTVSMELGNRTVDLEVLEVLPPPEMPEMTVGP